MSTEPIIGWCARFIAETVHSDRLRLNHQDGWMAHARRSPSLVSPDLWQHISKPTQAETRKPHQSSEEFIPQDAWLRHKTTMQQQGPPDKPGAASAPPPQYADSAVPVAVAMPVQQQQPISPQQVYTQMSVAPTINVQIVAPASPRPAGWSSGLCGCTDNCCNLWMVVCCPCVTFGQISARVGNNGCCDCGCVGSACLCAAVSMTGFGFILTCLLRQKVAAATGVNQNCCDDFCMACWCEPCVLCQMANHLDIQKDSCSFAAPPRLESMQR